MRAFALVGAVIVLTVCSSPEPSESLPLAERLRLERQWEFVTNFMPPDSGGCVGSELTTARLCLIKVESDLLNGPLEIEIEVDGDDDVLLLTTGMDKVRTVLEEPLARLYAWALASAPEQTREVCGFEEKTDLEVFAWEPGYRADYECGQHLASLTEAFLGD